MNTLESLRATLESHADVADPAMVGRSTSIHRRIRVVRRRRRAAAVVGAVAAVLALVAGIALPSLSHRSSQGLPAATTVTSGGFAYRLVKVVELKPGQKSLSIPAPRAGQHEAFALLAHRLDGGHASLGELLDAGSTVMPGQKVDQTALNGQSPAVPFLDSGLLGSSLRGYRLTLTGGGADTRAGVAVYERTSAMPAGVADPTRATVFRETIGSQHLLAAAFAKSGQAEVTFRFTGRIDETALGGFCAWRTGRVTVGTPYVNVSIDGHGAVSSAGCGALSEDAWNGGFVSDDSAAGEHAVRVWTSDAQGGPARFYNGVILGGAAYDDRAAVIIDGNRVDPVVERDARTWRLDPSATAHHQGSGHSLEVSVNSDDPVLFGFASNQVERIDAIGENTLGDDGGFRSTVGGPSSSIGLISAPGATASYKLTWPAKDTNAQVSVLVYRLVR